MLQTMIIITGYPMEWMPQVESDFVFLYRTFYIIEKSREYFDRNNEALMNPVQWWTSRSCLLTGITLFMQHDLKTSVYFLRHNIYVPNVYNDKFFGSVGWQLNLNMVGEVELLLIFSPTTFLSPLYTYSIVNKKKSTALLTVAYSLNILVSIPSETMRWRPHTPSLDWTETVNPTELDLMPKEPSTTDSASSCGGCTGKGRRVKERLTFNSHKSSRDHLRSPFKKVHIIIRGNQKYKCTVKKQKFGDRWKNECAHKDKS